jgi:murein DD-endopeptidase MepM/ murein hydrolase activator NlpD
MKPREKKIISSSARVFYWRLFFMFTVFVCALWTVAAVRAQELGNQLLKIELEINKKNGALNQLENEIKQYEKDLEDINAQAQTLETAVARFDISVKKFSADIKLTENNIKKTKSEILSLEKSIKDKEYGIGRNIEALGEALRRLRQAESRTLVEVVLSNANFSEALDEAESLKKFQQVVKEDTNSLRGLKTELLGLKTGIETERDDLVGLRNQLEDKKDLVELQRKEKDSLLAVTKNKEASFQEILDEKRRQKEAFERELLALETALKIAIDPDKIAQPSPGILAWPLESIRITQNFGDTPFSRANPGVYNGKGHNGIDFRAPSGTMIKASLSGVVEGIGNTDEVRGCYSYGKWVLIRHTNGLSTLYAHLSLIRVQAGQEVSTGEIIGYSGSTGYSTGPHLHFTVYATQGVQIQKFDKSVNCKNTYIPIADLKAYINPLLYLPGLEA